MLKEKIRAIISRSYHEIVKGSRFIFYLFPIRNNKIVVDNFGGNGFGDNPKYIVKELLKEDLNLKIIWIVKRNVNTREFPKEVHLVRAGSIKSAYEYATAKIWIDNIKNFYKGRKRKGQIYIQTWHSSFALKLVEGQTEGNLDKKYVKNAKKDGHITDGIIACTNLQRSIFQKYFWLNKNTEILLTGLPRNDIFFDEEQKTKIIRKVHKCFNIPEDYKIILYMPTFRDDGSSDVYQFDYLKIIKCFEKRFSTKCKLIVKLHPNAVKESKNIEYNECVLEGSNYSNAEELCIGSDYLITDYSSVFYNFILLDRPVYLYTPDYDIYKRSRGLSSIYDTLPFPRASTEEEMQKSILEYDVIKGNKRMEAFRHDIQTYDDGKAAEYVSKWLLSKM